MALAPPRRRRASTPAAQAPASPPAAVPSQKPYTETIPGTPVTFDMVPIPGGTFQMGSPPAEKGRKRDEGPQRAVTVRPFFMGKHEVTWDAYHLFLDLGIENVLKPDQDKGPDALSYPTPPYADETFGLGRGKSPNIAVTWHAAMEFARWISRQTGKRYRLPTEAEWEYACRAGTATPYSFGADASQAPRQRLVRRQLPEAPPPRRRKTPERVRALRHARQRVRVGHRSIRT